MISKIFLSPLSSLYVNQLSDSILESAPLNRLHPVSLRVFLRQPVPLRFDPLHILLLLDLLLNDVHLLDLVLAPVPLTDLLEVLLLEHAHLPLHHNLVVPLLPRTVHALLVLQVLLLHLLLDVLQGLTRVSPDLTRLVLNVKLMLLNPLPPLLVIFVVEFTLKNDIKG